MGPTRLLTHDHQSQQVPALAWMLLIGLLVCSLLPALEGCSRNTVCVTGINQNSLNPQGSICKTHCDCNNQNYEGYCIDGLCKALERERCDVAGRSQRCLPQATFQAATGTCTEGIRTCKAPGLTTLRWGNCTCASSETIGDAGPLPEANQEPQEAKGDAGPPELADGGEDTPERIAEDPKEGLSQEQTPEPGAQEQTPERSAGEQAPDPSMPDAVSPERDEHPACTTTSSSCKNTTCVPRDGQSGLGFCFAACDPPPLYTCPNGQECITIGPGSNTPFCAPIGPKGYGAVCQKVPDFSKQAIDLSKHCASGLFCMHENNNPSPGASGVCMRWHPSTETPPNNDCTAPANASKCKQGEQCVPHPNNNGIACGIDCSLSQTCPTGTTCKTLGTGTKVCFPSP